MNAILVSNFVLNFQHISSYIQHINVPPLNLIIVKNTTADAAGVFAHSLKDVPVHSGTLLSPISYPFLQAPPIYASPTDTGIPGRGSTSLPNAANKSTLGLFLTSFNAQIGQSLR